MSVFLTVECALEDEVLEDGAETQMECNKCVCACGNWVCTALTCNGDNTNEHNTNAKTQLCYRMYCLSQLDFFGTSGDHQVETEADEGAEGEEMTEEEWSRSVAELNALHMSTDVL